MIRVNDKVSVKVFNKAKQGKSKSIRVFTGIIKGIYKKFILLQHIDTETSNYTECFLNYQIKNGEVKLRKIKNE